MEEAFGFHPKRNVTHFNSRYLTYDHLATPKERCLLVKSRTGSGTVARQIALRYATKRILYLVSSKPLAYTVRDSLNKTVRLGAQLDFALYLDTREPLCNFQHLVCTCQSLWRPHRMAPKPNDLIIVDELTSVIEDFTGITSKWPQRNQEAFLFFSTHCTKWGLDAHLTDTHSG